MTSAQANGFLESDDRIIFTSSNNHFVGVEKDVTNVTGECPQDSPALRARWREGRMHLAL